MKKLILIAFVLLSVGSYAQQNRMHYSLLTKTNGEVIYNNYSPEIKGSPYFHDSWSTGTVELYDSTVYVDIQVRYNADRDELEYLKEAGGEYRLNSQMVKRFSFRAHGQEMVFRNGIMCIDEYSAFDFFRVHCEGKADFVERYQKVLREPTEVNGYSNSLPVQHFETVQRYYIIIDNTAERLNTLNRRNVIKAFSDEPRVEEYIKENRLRCKEISEVTEVVNYYNLLQAE